MGRGAIDLDKLYKKEGNMHYYKVSSPHYENAEMFVRVNGNQKEIVLFEIIPLKIPSVSRVDHYVR